MESYFWKQQDDIPEGMGYAIMVLGTMVLVYLGTKWTVGTGDSTI